jgi:CPA1 family monovalent cation:H+ antiporter
LWHFYVRKDYRKTQESKTFMVHAIIGCWAGMRGIVSMTAALALPYSLPNGLPLEGRDVTVFLTFEIIFLTLVIPGLTIPLLIKWLNIQPTASHDEMVKVRKKLSEVAIFEIHQMHSSKHLDDAEKELLCMYFNSHNKIREISSISEEHKIEKARHRILQKQRDHLLKIWLNNEMDDNLLNDLERELDIEESHLARGEI